MTKKVTTSLADNLGELRTRGPAMLDIANGFGACTGGRQTLQKLSAAFASLGVRDNAKVRGPEYSGF